MAYKRLGDLLQSVGLISSSQLEEALALQKETKERLGTLLISHGFITENQLIEALQMQLGIEFIDLSKAEIDPQMSAYVPKNIARKHGVVPVRVEKDRLYLAMKDPMNFVAQEEVKTASRKRVIPMISTSNGVDRAILNLYGNEGVAKAIEEMKQQASALPDQQEESAGPVVIGEEDSISAPTVRLVNSIIERAVTERVSDIHIEPREDDLTVRMRIDGMLHRILNVPKDLQASVISRIKVMGKMNIAEHRIPQDGRANVRIKSEDVDLRISTLPTIYGEKVVIRLLNKSTSLLSKSGIGLTGADLEKYVRLISNHNGVVLIVGPTGSGKSSTMYTMIGELNREEVNLVTLEDPVEYNISGINQVQINEKVGMTFANGLRSILRQDPDIIAVGEIRDGETAEIAMRAAITGHLVLSTIHTNDAISTIDRLKDIGVEPYLIASALNGIISQRLVRCICPNCKTAYTPTEEELEVLGLKPEEGRVFYKGKGCPHCFDTGYRGRTGVFEILIMNRETRRCISENDSKTNLLKAAEGPDFVSIRDNCRRLVLEGVTTVEEAKRTINSVE